MSALLNEIRLHDGNLAEQIRLTLAEIAGCDVSSTVTGELDRIDGVATGRDCRAGGSVDSRP